MDECIVGHATLAAKKKAPSTARRATPPSVLVFSFDAGPVLELRVRAPLNALFEAGKIAGYNIVNGGGHPCGPHQLEEYDCVMVQRDAPSWFLGLMLELGVPFVYDLDDLMLVAPSYSHLVARGDPHRLAEHAMVVTVATQVLREKFEKHSGLSISGKTMVVPNGLSFPQGNVALATCATGLTWTSSDFSSLGHSKEDVLAAISRFAVKFDLPVHLFGHFQEALVQAIPNVKYYGMMHFSTHKMFLASTPGLIGVAPLETVCDETTKDFIESKSDLKMVEFGGFGHPGVYSAVAPYLESDLKTGRVVENDFEAWYDALHEARERIADPHFIGAEQIRSKRDIRILARQNRLEALLEVASDRTLSLSDIEKSRPSGGEMPRGYYPIRYQIADKMYSQVRRLPGPLKRVLIRLGTTVAREKTISLLPAPTSRASTRKTMRRVAILLSVHNGTNYLRNLLESLCRQTHPIELIVRDDGSTDDTVPLIETYTNRLPITILKGQNLGFTRSFFKLIDSAPAGVDFAGFCDHDDVWEPAKVERAVEQLSGAGTGDTPRMYCSRLKVVDERLRFVGLSNLPRKPLGFRNALVENVATGCTMLLNAPAVRLLKEMPPGELEVIYDAWTYLVISAFGEVLFDDQAHILYRQHRQNVIGMRLGLRQWPPRLRRSFKRLRFPVFFPTALAFYERYGDRMPGEKRKILETYLFDRRTVTRRLTLLKRTGIYRQGRLDQAILWLLVAIGRD